MSTPRGRYWEWTISRSSMLTPSSPAIVVTWASTPGRSGMTTCNSVTELGRLARGGRFRRASWARSRRVTRLGRSSSATMRRTSFSLAMRSSRTGRMAGALSRQMSGQIAGDPAAIRVMSLKPPAARRSSAVWASVASVASPMRVAAVRCGTWETTATRSSCRSGASATRSAPRLAMTDWILEKAFGSVDDVGVRTQVEPANSSGSAPSGPSCSDPAIGCPPTKRGCEISETIGPFTPPTSVTTSSPD